MARTMLITRRDFVADPATTNFTGGAWLTPFSTLIDPRPQTVLLARSPEPDDTWFQMDLGVERQVGLFHFQRLGVTRFGFLRVKFGNDGNFVSNNYDSGLLSAWPQDKAPGTNDPWGELTVNGVYIEDEYVAMGLPRFVIPTAPVRGRYLRVEIQDTTNSQAPYVGVFGACETWAPLRSPGFGWSITTVDESDVQTVPYGSRFIVPRNKRRRLSIGFDSTLSKDEVVKVIYGWAMMMGKSRPFVISVFPDDTPNVEKQTVWGTLSNEPEITNPHYASYSMSLQIEQLI